MQVRRLIDNLVQQVPICHQVAAIVHSNKQQVVVSSPSFYLRTIVYLYAMWVASFTSYLSHMMSVQLFDVD